MKDQTWSPRCGAGWIILIAAGVADAQNPEFPAGVAAGDVTDTAAVCWTQTPMPESLRLEVARDETFTQLAAVLVADTDEASGLTAKVEVSGLAPATTFFYRFIRIRDGALSPIGRFRTAPPPEESVPFRFLFTGDSNAARQPFRLLAFARDEQPDLWFWFGDTIYSDVAAGGLGVARTLDEYRAKYRQNLADPHLQALLASSAVWTGWDDHEVTNDYDGGDPQPGLSRTRIHAAYQAFFEHMPIRPQNLDADPYRIYRSFRYGGLAEFFILDGRQYRSADAARVTGAGITALDPFAQLLPTRDERFLAVTRDPDRTLLGKTQLDWLKQSVTASPARFKFIINPVPFTSLLLLPDDRWDGYDAERFDLLRSLDLAGVEGVIVLTTDSHANTVNPDVTQYLRRHLFQQFSPDFAVPEFITGPIGTGTIGGVVRGVAASLFGGPDNPFGRQFGELLTHIALHRVAVINQLTFAEPDRFAYLVVDVTEQGVTLTHRGIRPDDAAGPARIEDLNRVTLDARGRAPAPPCFLFPLLAVTGLCTWATHTTRRAKARRTARRRRPPYSCHSGDRHKQSGPRRR